MKYWDVEAAGTNTETFAGNKAIYSLSYNNKLDLVATGHADKSIRLWDKRSKDEEVFKSYRSHTAWATTVQWHPNKEYWVISGGYDNAIKIWDIRSKTPMHSINNAHSDKILAITWLNDDCIVSGSSDCTLKCHILKN